MNNIDQYIWNIVLSKKNSIYSYSLASESKYDSMEISGYHWIFSVESKKLSCSHSKERSFKKMKLVSELALNIE